MRLFGDHLIKYIFGKPLYLILTLAAIDYPLSIFPQRVIVFIAGFSAFGAGIDVEVTFVDSEAFDTTGVKEDEKIIEAADLISYKLMVSDHEIERHPLQVKGVGSAAGELITQESTIGACNKYRLTDKVSNDLNGEDQAAVKNMAVTGVTGAFGKEFMLKEVF